VPLGFRGRVPRSPFRGPLGCPGRRSVPGLGLAGLAKTAKSKAQTSLQSQ